MHCSQQEKKGMEEKKMSEGLISLCVGLSVMLSLGLSDEVWLRGRILKHSFRWEQQAVHMHAIRAQDRQGGVDLADNSSVITHAF